MSRPACLTIDESALASNLRAFRQACGQRPTWAVVKARGYGHGIPSCVRGFAAAEGLALLELEEAAEARGAGWAKPILLIEGVFSEADHREALTAVTDLVIHSSDQLGWLLTHLGDLGPQHRIWLKLNTGMNRLGFQVREDALLTSAIERLRGRLPLERIGFMMHFASGEIPAATALPRQSFFQRLKQLGHQAVQPISLSNSAASLSISPLEGEWLRPGIALYGSSPFGFEAASTEMRPRVDWAGLAMQAAARLTSQVIGIQQVEPGEAVGYGGRFVASRKSRIGTVALGYADGVLRQTPDGTPVWVDGRLCPLAGRVSMDLLTVDLTDHPAAGLGSPVECWGPHLSVDQVAAACGTIGYELLTGVTQRVHRRLVGGA